MIHPDGLVAMVGRRFAGARRACLALGIVVAAVAFHVVPARAATTGAETITGVHWTKLTPPTHPPARQDGAMAYDAARRNVVLFGGFSNGAFRNDTWVWDGARWSRKSHGDSPTPRYGAGMSYDAALGKVILFGGFGPLASGDSWFDDT